MRFPSPFDIIYLASYIAPISSQGKKGLHAENFSECYRHIRSASKATEWLTNAAVGWGIV
jgi:hypothetical protein